MKEVHWQLAEILSKEKIKLLRKNGYNKPIDCEMQYCSNYRPSCSIGLCKIAVDKCEDF